MNFFFQKKSEFLLNFILKKVFHPITYENNTELANTHDPISRRALEIQITEYGQTPKQIFFKPHPKRFTNNKLSDNSMKENSLGQALKQINFTEKDFELVQNLDENLLGASHIHIKLPNENISKSFILIFKTFSNKVF